MSAFPFKAHAPRVMPDPVTPGRARHVFFCSVLDLPQGLPKGANPRAQDDVDRGIYRDIKRSLLNQEETPNTFHQKNKGITLLAESAVKSKNDDGDEIVSVTFAEDNSKQGVIDGAHTYEIILQSQDFIRKWNATDQNPINQYVKVEVLEGIYDALAVEIAGGLNTAVKVQQMSLANLGERFDWIKGELKDAGMLQLVAFQQNEQLRKNEEKDYDVRDIIRFLDLFNVSEYPNSGANYPIRAYTSKEAVLKYYLGSKADVPNASQYERLRPLLRDILALHDTVSSQARDLYNAGGSKRAGKLKFVEGPSAPDKKFQFRFIGGAKEYRLTGGALLPILGAFRAAVIEDPKTGLIGWHNGFENVLRVWNETGKALMEATQETSEELGRNPNAIGKSRKHWAYLHNIVLNHLYPR